ncbi:MAG: hypothetical protein PVJ09_00200 [Candidatus Woesebacteria bacterium]|jgi:hypothetical protein
MKKNTYITEFDEKIFWLIDLYENKKISKKVLKISIGFLFQRHYGHQFQELILQSDGRQKLLGINYKKITEYYNDPI